jgi:hypothetical protein
MTHLPMITNDEAVELLDYIAMNDLENAYDAERDAISADMYDNCDPSEFSDTRTIRRRASLLTNSPSGFKFNQKRQLR